MPIKIFLSYFLKTIFYKKMIMRKEYIVQMSGLNVYSLHIHVKVNIFLLIMDKRNL